MIKIYLIGIKKSYCPLGKHNILKINTTSEYKIKKLAKEFAQEHNYDKVYLVDDYPTRTELDKLSKRKLEDFVNHKGKTIYKRQSIIF